MSDWETEEIPVIPVISGGSKWDDEDAQDQVKDSWDASEDEQEE